jgi:anti-sigma regulatory factor (Ser/Thr protein kinase)
MRDLLLELPAQPSTCTVARHAIRNFCARTSQPESADDAELLTSELVTNAIRQSSALVTVRAHDTVNGITVTVTDDVASPLALVASVPPGMAEHGRGIHVVAQIASAWGSDSHPNGHSVWFHLHPPNNQQT